MVFDCFPFFNELEILELRLAHLADVVDRFVIVESPLTFTGKPKPLYFAENRRRFAPWADRIIHIVTDDMPGGSDCFVRERHQRNSIIRGLEGCAAGDIILSSDADELFSHSAIRAFDPQSGPRTAQMANHYYYLNCRHACQWEKNSICTYADLRRASADELRMKQLPMIDNGGWHFSYCGGVDRIIAKLESFSHTEYATDHYKNPRRIAQAIARGEDLFGRHHLGGFALVPIDDTFPACVRENSDRLTRAGLICEPASQRPAA